MTVPSGPKTKPRVILDGLFFLVGTGIGSVWRALFKELATRRLDFDLIVLSYLGAAPKIPGVLYLELPFPGGRGYPASQLELVCEQLNIDLFVSTYYSFPERTPSLLLVHDCIPDVFNYDTKMDLQWGQRKAAIERASAYLTVSNHTTFDLVHFYPAVNAKPLTVSRLGSHFQTLSANQPNLAGIDINKAFFVFISAFKNIECFFEATELLHRQTASAVQVVFTNVDASFVDEVNRSRPYLVATGRRFSEEELKWLYIHSAALIYPSVYEGFGLPILDAISCGGRVVCGTNSSLPEAALGRAIEVEPMNAGNLAAAICRAIADWNDECRLAPERLPSAEVVAWTKFTDDFLYATRLALDRCSIAGVR